jgi:metal transporter CNNM
MAVVVKRTKEAGASSIEKQNSTIADYKINPKDAHADGT